MLASVVPCWYRAVVMQAAESIFWRRSGTKSNVEIIAVPEQIMANLDGEQLEPRTGKSR